MHKIVRFAFFSISARALPRLPTSRLLPMTGPTTAFSVTGSHVLARSESTEELRQRLNSAQYLSCLTLQARYPPAGTHRRAWRLPRPPPPGLSVLVGHCFRERVATARVRVAGQFPRSGSPRRGGASLLPCVQGFHSVSSIRQETNTLIKRKPNGPRRSLHLIHFLGNKRFAAFRVPTTRE